MKHALACIVVVLALPMLAKEKTVAFHYGPALTPRQLEFFADYEVLITHDPLPRAQVTALRKRGVQLAIYEWSVAYYRTLAMPWHRRAPVLNAKPLRGGVGANDADAFYYDPAAPGFASSRARNLAARLRAIGYEGVFFDTTTAQSVHPEAREEYRRRHPDLPYDAAFSRFLAALRKELPDGVIVTNQGYRAAEFYLPHADFDITESLFTAPSGAKFFLRSRKEIDDLMNAWILPAARRYPHVRYVHLNYVDEPDPTLIDAIVSIAREYGHQAYVALPDVTRTAMMPHAVP